MTDPVASLMDPEFTHDPNRAYARLREQAPLVRIGTPGAPPVWLVTRCADVRSMLSDPEIVVDHANVPGNEGTSLMDQLLGALDLPDDFRAEFRTYARNMMFVDGDEHARLRKLILPAFAVKRIKALRPAIEEMSARLLDALAAKGGGDLIEEYSSPLTGTVICELIGFDRADHPRVRKLMRSYADGDIHFSGREMVECTKELIARRRAEPADDLISTLVRTRDETGDRLSEDEMVAMVLLLIMNGHHSTSFFIPASVVALFRNPDQLALLRAEPELMPDAIEELLRVANPVPVTSPRYATRDMELSGCPVRKGETLTGSFFAANFDPRAFPDPERLDLRRERRRGEGHVSFGAGPHYCTGAALAKLETDVALRHLLLDRDTLEIAVPLDELEYTDATLGVHMLAGLPVWL